MQRVIKNSKNLRAFAVKKIIEQELITKFGRRQEMWGKYFSRGSKDSFYLPGQEIKISRNTSFGGLTCEKDALSVCRFRVMLAILGFFFVYAIITIRLFGVCVLSNIGTDHITREAMHHDILPISPIKRADIIDRNGALIATSLPTVNLFANPKKIINPHKAAQSLSKVLPELSYDDILPKLKRRGSFVYLKRNLTPSQQYDINALGIPGLEFEDGEKRIYPHSNLFAHIIGNTNIDNNGISGIERKLNERLTSSTIPLKLTIDLGVQDTIRELLLEGVTKYQAEAATAILMDVNSGEVISMVSVPDYNPNQAIRPDAKSTFNMATKGVYEPGSVLKVFNTAMSLESGKVKVADKFDATQPLKLKYNTIKDYRGENRWLSVPEILVYSSNIGSARMALQVGGDKQKEFMKKIGFFSELPIEVPEKGQPLVPNKWGEGTIATVAYGYGLAVTPLHVITAFSAMVNGGIYHEPTLVKRNYEDDGKRVISYNTSLSMRKLLRLVVEEGSGKRANVKGYEVAGKTGTANKLSAEGKYVDKKVRTTFVSAFPISNPKYALLLMLDEPKPIKETWGFVTSGWNTVPTAGKIIEAIAPQLNLKANYDLDELRANRIIEASYSN